MLADPKMVPDHVALERVAAHLGARVVLFVRRLRVSDGTPRHDPELFASAYRAGLLKWQGSDPMAMTAAVKDELAHLTITRPCCRKAEVSSMLRFAGGLHIVSGRIVVEAEIDTGATARRLRKDIAEVYGHSSDVAVVAAGGLRKGSRYLVRIAKDGEKAGAADGPDRRPWPPGPGGPASPQVVSGFGSAMPESAPGGALSSLMVR